MKNSIAPSLLAAITVLFVPAASAQWLTNGSSIYYNGGKVGIGTSAPSNALHVVDPVNQGVGIFQNPNGRVGLGVDGSGGYLQSDGINFSFFAGTNRVLFGSSANGRVGIGTTSSLAKLHVAGVGSDGIRTESDVLGGDGIEATNLTASTASFGVYGRALAGKGVAGFSDTGDGVYGSTSSGNAVYGQSVGAGLAGRFIGNVAITGSISKGSGTFKIDHPLDPENKYLYHSFVESPDMMNMYNGVVVLDASGSGVVTMPEYFEALNRQFRYQLTCIGGYSPVYIASEINGNQFMISGGQPGLKVSWLVMGVRHDRFAEKNRVQVEVDKAAEERGFYLHPEAFDEPASKAIPSIRNNAASASGKGRVRE